MHSNRFGLPIVLTEHARLRMEERGIDAVLILDTKRSRRPPLLALQVFP